MAVKPRRELCIEEAFRVLSDEIENVISILRARGYEEPSPHIVAEVIFRKQGGNVARKINECVASKEPPRFSKEGILKAEELADIVSTLSEPIRTITEAQIRMMILGMMRTLGGVGTRTEPDLARIGASADPEIVGAYIARVLMPNIQDIANIINQAKDEAKEMAKQMVRDMVRDTTFFTLSRASRASAVIYRLKGSNRKELIKEMERGRRTARTIASTLLAPFTIFSEEEKAKIEDEAEKQAIAMYEAAAEAMPKEVRVIPEVVSGADGYWALKEIVSDVSPEGRVVTVEVFEFIPLRREVPTPITEIRIRVEKDIKEIIRRRVDLALLGLRREIAELNRLRVERAIERLEKLARRKEIFVRLRPHQFDMAYKTLRLYPGEKTFSGSLLALAYMMVRHRRKMFKNKTALQVYQSARGALELIPERFYENEDVLLQELRSRIKRVIDGVKQNIRRALGEEAEEYVERREKEIDGYVFNVERAIEKIYSNIDPREVGAEEMKRMVIDAAKFLENNRRERMNRESTMYNMKLETLRIVIEGRQLEVIRNIAASELRFLITRVASR
jgi:hypothetical protein